MFERSNAELTHIIVFLVNRFCLSNCIIKKNKNCYISCFIYVVLRKVQRMVLRQATWLVLCMNCLL
jgi:hypothetical protein